MTNIKLVHHCLILRSILPINDWNLANFFVCTFYAKDFVKLSHRMVMALLPASRTASMAKNG